MDIPARATSIVILRNANQIYIGADSRRSYHEPGERFAGTVCKIIRAGRLVFVASGLTFANNQQVADIGREVGRRNLTVSQAIEEFRNRMSTYLPQALTARDKVESSSRNGLVLEAAFLAIENNIAKVSVEWFRLNYGPAGPSVTTDRHSYSSRSVRNYDFLFLGKRHSIDQYLSHQSVAIRGDQDAIQFITHMIDLEIAESPETTAPPIDILQLTKYGGRWLARKPGCE